MYNIVNSSKKNEKSYMFLLFGMCLNQSNVIWGINFSLADIFLILLCGLMIYEKKFQIHMGYIIPFLTLSFFLLINSFLISPIVFQVYPTIKVITEYIKLLIVFVFFLTGHNLAFQNKFIFIIKGLSYGSFIISIISIFVFSFKIPVFSEYLFFGEARLKGLTNDPNYFALIQLVAVIYFSRVKNLKVINKVIFITPIIFTIILSGSKSGLIILFCYTLLRLIVVKELSFNTVIKKTFLIVFSLILTFLFSKFIYSLIDYFSYIPQVSRLSILFTNFDEAVTGDGSGRTDSWETSLSIIKMSPFIGTGIGNYLNISNNLFGINSISHNTYLQFLSEWGIFIGGTFIAFLIIVFMKAMISSNKYDSFLISKDIYFVFLLGSFSISLNNSRIFILNIAVSLFYVLLKRENQPVISEINNK